jgi:hypothetical protein
MNEQDLLRLLRARKSGQGQRSWRCPDEADLAAYVDARLADRAQRRLEAHLADCVFCLDRVVFLLRREVSPEPEVPPGLLARARDLGADGKEARWWAEWRWRTAAAAAACVVLGVFIWLRQPSPPSVPFAGSPTPSVGVSPPAAPAATAVPSAPPRVVRNGRRASVALRLLFPREGAIVPREGSDFRWTEVRGCLFYEIRLMTGEGDLVWEARVEATQTRIPANVQLAPGGKYFVSVRAYLPEGKTLPAGVVGFLVAEDR